MMAEIECPYCGEEVPIRIMITGELTDAYLPDEYISIGGTTSDLEKPIPEITVSLDANLEGLSRDIDKIISEKRDRQKRFEETISKRKHK